MIKKFGANSYFVVVVVPLNRCVSSSFVALYCHQMSGVNNIRPLIIREYVIQRIDIRHRELNKRGIIITPSYVATHVFTPRCDYTHGMEASVLTRLIYPTVLCLVQ